MCSRGIEMITATSAGRSLQVPVALRRTPVGLARASRTRTLRLHAAAPCAEFHTSSAPSSSIPYCHSLFLGPCTSARRNYYEILGVSKSASQEEIKRAYAKVFHLIVPPLLVLSIPASKEAPPRQKQSKECERCLPSAPASLSGPCVCRGISCLHLTLCAGARRRR